MSDLGWNAQTVYRNDRTGSIVLRFNGESSVTLRADGTVDCNGYKPDRDAWRVLELMASVLKFHVAVGTEPALYPVVDGRMLELAERVEGRFPWRTVGLDHDTVTDVRELVNWVLYRDRKVRESVVAALAGTNEREQP